MDDSNNINAKMLGRFAVPGQEMVYKLFDAFLSKTVLEDRLIDFSKPPIEHDDGSVEFETLNAGDGASVPSFSWLILGQPVASVYEFLDEPLLEKPEEPAKPRDLNPPERPGDYKEIKVPKRKKKDTDEEYQAKMLKYEQEV